MLLSLKQALQRISDEEKENPKAPCLQGVCGSGILRRCDARRRALRLRRLFWRLRRCLFWRLGRRPSGRASHISRLQALLRNSLALACCAPLKSLRLAGFQDSILLSKCILQQQAHAEHPCQQDAGL
jgi:hypothetical protein